MRSEEATPLSTARPGHTLNDGDTDALRRFCELVGTPNLQVYLGLYPHTNRHEALILLERKRRMLEAALDRSDCAREAEILLDHFDVLRRALDAHQAPDRRDVTATPDYYRVLGVHNTASYAEIERAYRGLAQNLGGDGGLIAQAWRVLGDPLNRANYDGSRRAGAAPDEDEPHDLPTGAEPMDLGAEEVGGSRAELPGPDTREVVLEGEAPSLRSVALVVRGPGRWRARISSDHPCMQVRPADVVDVSPGRHTLGVRFDPRLLDHDRVTCTLTLANADEQHVLVFKLRRVRATAFERFEPIAIGVLAFTLVALGWALGTRYSVVSSREVPDSIGSVDQIPTAARCFLDARTALPAWLDVHTDGLGRPTGFSFGGPVSPKVEACVKQSLLDLDFPPTPHGLPAFHRYHIPLREAQP
jgi:hypothetical protein